MADLDQSPALPFDLIARGPTQGFVKDYSGAGGGGVPGGSPGQVQTNNFGTFGGLTNTQLTALVNPFTNTLKGSVPASGGGTSTFLRADGTWASASGGGGGFTTPQNFGAFADNTLHAITQADINANLGVWWGLYDLGTAWDTVALQEAIYACFGDLTTSTRPPANAVKVIASVDTLYGDPGKLVNGNTAVHAVNIGSRSGFTGTGVTGKFIRFFFRAGPTVVTEATLYSANAVTNGTWQWQGSNSYNGPWTNIGATFPLGGNATQVQTTLNANVTAYQYYQLLGISGTADPTNDLREIQFKEGGVYVTTQRGAVNQWFPNQTLKLFLPKGSYFVNRGLLLVAAQFSLECEGRADSQLMWWGDSQTAVLTTDSAAYCNFTNLAFNVQNNCDTIWIMTGTSTYGGLHTQQITIYDLVLFGNGITRYGIQVSPAGNAAQGDTIEFINPYISGCFTDGLSTGGQNALSIQITNGDFQSCTGSGIHCYAGTVLVDGTSFQNQANGLQSSPPQNQIVNDGGDIRGNSGQGQTNIITLQNVRSESDVFLHHDVVTSTVQNCTLAGAGFNDWFANYPYLIGHLVNPSVNNTKGRQFLVVGDGVAPNVDVESYPNGWRAINTSTSTDTVIVDNSGASYTVNQWTGFSLHYRYGSNGFTKHADITTNTATAISTSASAGYFDSNVATTLYHIGGKTGAVAPNFDSLAPGGAVWTGAVGQGFSTTAGSNIISGTTSIGTLQTGDAIVIPHCKFVGVAGATITETAYIGRVVGGGGTAGPWTMDKTCAATLTAVGGYFGPTLVDNKIIYLHLRSPAVRSAISVIDSFFQVGELTNIQSVRNSVVATRSKGGGWWSTNTAGTANDPSIMILPGPVDLINTKQYRGVLPAGLLTGTVDLTSLFSSADAFTFTPSGNITFNAPVPEFLWTARRITFYITTQGTTSRTITFGTNFDSAGPIVTGITDNVKFSITFENAAYSSDIPGATPVPLWREVSRYPVNGIPVTVGLLPTVGVKGRRAFVTDATAVTFQTIVAGAGANNVPVFDDGTNWRIG